MPQRGGFIVPSLRNDGDLVKGRVVHLSREPYEVYIGRANGFKRLKASKWAKGMDGSREEVIAKYEAYIRQRPDLLADLHELDGKVLGCWCAPSRVMEMCCSGSSRSWGDELESRRRRLHAK
jgi:hypothetical protein